MTQSSSDVRRSGFACAFIVSVVGLAAAAGACSSGLAAGDEGAACYPNDTCNAGLTCNGGKCVGSKGSGGGGASGSTGHTASAGGGSGTGGSGTGGSGMGGASSTTASSSGGGDSPPVFLDFGTNVTSITVGQSVTFTAVLTDPDGIADLVGGDLTDESGATYGAFQASGQMGSFQLTVSWAQMNQTQPIAFAYGTNGQRTFTAKFFDMEGKSAQMSTPITLTCNGLQAIAGACYDTMNDPSNCGAVGKSCGSGGTCYHGECAVLSACAAAVTSCNAMCTAAGKVCANECDGSPGLGGLAFTALACGGAPNSVSCTSSLTSYKTAYCCCF